MCEWIRQNPASMHKTSLGDTEILSNHCVVASQIIHLFISNHCVGVQVSDTKLCLVFGWFFQAGNSITGGSNRGGG